MLDNYNLGMPLWKKVVKRVRNILLFLYYSVTARPNAPFDAAFGVGAYKTGTTSLHHFLKQNGMRHLTLHTRVKAAYAGGDWDYLDRIVERYNTFDDNPWNKLDVIEHFAAKDRDYRFILTTRDPDKWFKSFQKHQARYGHVPPRDDQRDEVVRTMLTDRAEACREILRRHGKPFIEIDLTQDTDRERRLLDFLELPDKGFRFPHSNHGAT